MEQLPDVRDTRVEVENLWCQMVMAGAVAVGGLLNGASVPDSFESDRIAFYHWGFTLAFLELLILLVVATTLSSRATGWEHHGGASRSAAGVGGPGCPRPRARSRGG